MVSSRLMGVALVAGCLFAAVAAADEPRGPQILRAPKLAYDLDGIGALVAEEDAGSVAAAGAGCLDIGGSARSFQGTTPNRYRGDAFLITGSDTVLHQAKMRMIVGGIVRFNVSVHQLVATDPDEVWSRVMPDVQIQVVGDGFTPMMVSSGQLLDPNTAAPGLPLAQDATYAIAFAWSSTSVRYFRDETPYPRSFLHGDVLGTLQLNIAPPVEDDLINPAISEAGAYAMELCFAPVPGACCDPSVVDASHCEERLEADCTSSGVFFHGERTTCADYAGNCVFGACCTTCADCLPDYSPGACRDVGGTWAGPGVDCGAGGLCEPVTGACCDGATCREVCAADCLAGGGTYKGNGTDCL